MPRKISQKSLKGKSNFRKTLLSSAVIVVGASAILILLINLALKPETQIKTESVSVKTVSSQIMTNGTVGTQNQAVLSFLTAGRLTYLPFKEGDSVIQGQTIASLDTYALQRQIQLAANAYEMAKNSTATTNENFQANVLEGQFRLNLDMSNKTSYSNITEAQVITDEVKRIVDNANLSESSAQLNVDLANYTESLATLTSPINGILTREDVTNPNVNVTPATTFVVSDPNSMVFKAQVMEQDIDFVSVGSAASIHLDGNLNELQGTVVAIHPAETVINGQGVYLVDIAVQDLQNLAHFGQGGFAKIQSNTNSSVKLIPTWLVLSNNYVWVSVDGKNILKKVAVGKTHGSEIEILQGLSDSDKVITNPESIIAKSYSIL